MTLGNNPTPVQEIKAQSVQDRLAFDTLSLQQHDLIEQLEHSRANLEVSATAVHQLRRCFKTQDF